MKVGMVEVQRMMTNVWVFALKRSSKFLIDSTGR